MNRLIAIFFSSLFFIGTSPGATDELKIDSKIQHDVLALVKAASNLKTAWPWQGPIATAKKVAKHGRNAGAALASQLKFEKPIKDDADFNVHVEQQVELALCLIYQLAPESGKTVYGIRSLDEENWTVKPFWLKKVGAGLNAPAQPGGPADAATGGTADR